MAKVSADALIIDLSQPCRLAVAGANLLRQLSRILDVGSEASVLDGDSSWRIFDHLCGARTRGHREQGRKESDATRCAWSKCHPFPQKKGIDNPQGYPGFVPGEIVVVVAREPSRRKPGGD